MKYYLISLSRLQQASYGAAVIGIGYNPNTNFILVALENENNQALATFLAENGQLISQEGQITAENDFMPLALSEEYKQAFGLIGGFNKQREQSQHGHQRLPK